MGRFYWDNPVQHDRPLITNCFVPGLAREAGLNPSSAIQEKDLDMLLTNIALADQEERPLSYSRHKGHNYRNITFGRLLSAVDKIKFAGLALERRTKPGHRGWQSDLRGSDALTEIFEKYRQKLVYGPRDLIILRSRKDDRLLTMRPSRDLTRQVERVNEMLHGIELGLGMTGALKLSNGLWLFERLEEDRFGNPRLVQQRLRLDQMSGRRVFTSDLKRHGRFYCAAQNVPASARLLMTLGGEQVVELDFQSMHVALAYNLCGAPLEGDPYEIRGFTRRQAKLGLLTAINATTPEVAIASLTDNRQGKRICASRGQAHRFLEAFKVRHASIEKMLCSDAGIRLMNLDARIILTAVDRLIGQVIPCIPIHDSLVVSQQHEEEAREALNFGWHNQNPRLTPCSIEKKGQKVSQYGGGGGGGGGGGAFWERDVLVEGCLDDPSDGWWYSVGAEARPDVVEWCASSPSYGIWTGS